MDHGLNGVRPFVKWAGGKQALAGFLAQRFPSEFGRYYEPFLGGGSVLMTLRPKEGTIGDANSWLMDAYHAIRNDQKAVANVLDQLPNTKPDYLRIRGTDPATLDLITRAAHFIYLNKTCFRGLFRVNKKGMFNVPYGAYNRRYYSPKNFAAVAGLLKDYEMRSGDFELVLDGIAPGDFAYLDPPYYKLGGYSDFNRYTPGQFRRQDHLRLAAVCRELDRKGAMWAISNSDTPLVRSLYEGFRQSQVSNRREINLKAGNRAISELLITNY